MDEIVLGGGCFWCIDAVFRRVKGVEMTVAGYAGGHAENPTYEKVASRATGHAEVVKIVFDSGIITLDTILDIFWTVHDPTTKDRQGADVGPEYRSIIFYTDNNQKKTIDKSIESASKLWPEPVVTEVKPIDKFYEAEDYHQDYFNKNPDAAYCQVVINPKLSKLREKFRLLLKEYN